MNVMSQVQDRPNGVWQVLYLRHLRILRMKVIRVRRQSGVEEAACRGSLWYGSEVVAVELERMMGSRGV